jgi:hypothetical protein
MKKNKKLCREHHMITGFVFFPQKSLRKRKNSAFHSLCVLKTASDLHRIAHTHTHTHSPTHTQALTIEADTARRDAQRARAEQAATQTVLDGKLAALITAQEALSAAVAETASVRDEASAKAAAAATETAALRYSLMSGVNHSTGRIEIFEFF